MTERRPLTTTERSLILKALSALKKETHPTDPDWDRINRFLDDMIAGKV